MNTKKTRRAYQQPGKYVSLWKNLREMQQRVNPYDILTTRLHSIDFNDSRAKYISIRFRTLALIFALLAPLWIPIDYMMMESATFMKFLVLRLIFSASLIALAMWGTVCNQLNAARMRITLFITITGLFYVSSYNILPDGSDSAIMLGYSFLPLLIMALMTIVPLTLLEGITYLVLITTFFITTHLMVGSLFTFNTLSQLWLLLLLGAIALWVEITQLHMLMRLYREATRDTLTGLVNRRILSAKIEEELALHSMQENDLCVLLFDLDLFKRVNDNHGHHTGDMVLQSFAGILQEHSQGDIVSGRYGGEEFLSILPRCNVETAIQLAEKIRVACHAVTVYSNDNEEVNFTTSIGVAQHKPNESSQDFLMRVDEGLYQAKAAGRDFVSVAE